MWAMLAAPLIAGNDLRNMSTDVKNVLTNKEVIAVNQDSLGVQGLRYTVRDSVEVWMKPLRGNDWAVCFLNRSVAPKHVEFNWQKEVLNDTFSKRILDAANASYTLQDLWLKKEVGDTRTVLKATVPAHDVLMFRLKRK